MNTIHCTAIFVILGLGRSQKWAKEGVLRPEIAKQGVFGVRKHGGYSPERCFLRVLVKISKNIGPMGGGF